MSDKANRKQPLGEVGLPVGTKIGKYEVRQKLGSGGQAIVYKCYDELLDRYVAVKQISAKLAEDPVFVERFRAEAQILAKLGAHQAEVTNIYELLANEQGLFIVMEFAAGESLEAILNKYPAPAQPRAALQILWRLAGGLHAVHEAGIIHRDLKPGNVIIGEGLKVKITDFGIATAAGGQTAVLMGTTKYMAPEIFDGETVDARSDIYSLGMIMYELLAGREKFNEVFADIIRDKHSEALRWMKWHGNAKVSAPLLSELNAEIPRALSDIVAKMMAKNPDDRFESMDQLGRTIKANFSTKAHGEPAVDAAAGVGRFTGPAELGSPDEADGLRIPPSEPATAPLPPVRLSSRAKLTIAIACAAAVVLAGLAAGWYIHAGRRLRARSAAEMYATAVNAFDKGLFADASQQFKALAVKYPKTADGVRASVMRPFADAYQAVANKDWTGAKSAEDAAMFEIRRLQGRGGELAGWSRRKAADLDEFKTYRVRTWTFFDALAAASQAADAGHFVQARSELNRRLLNFTPTPQQDAQLNAFVADLDARQFVGEVDRLFAEAAKYIGDGDFDQAEQAYQAVQAKLALPQSAKKLSTAKVKELADRLAAARSVLVADREYDAAVKAADAARQAGDESAELAALTKAAAARPGRADAGRIRELTISVALSEARALLADGKIADAEKGFQKVLEVDPANPDAMAGLADSQIATRRFALMVAARADIKAGDFAKALAECNKAAAIRSDAELDKMIVLCRYRIALAGAEKLRDEKKYDQALAAYEALRTIDPDQAATIDAWQAEIRLRQQYDQEVTAGDQSLVAGRWLEAIKHYRKAKSLIPGDRIDRKISEARYIENLAKAKTAIDQEDFNGAMGYLALAKKQKDTAEVNDLIKTVKEKLQQSVSP